MQRSNIVARKIFFLRKRCITNWIKIKNIKYQQKNCKKNYLLWEREGLKELKYIIKFSNAKTKEK